MTRNSSTPEYRKAQNARANAKKREHFRGLRVTAGCEDCGYNEDARQLHWHHQPGEVKLFDVSKELACHGWGALLAEVAKCVVLCVSCHHRRHALE